jgi:TRAP-type C4-dicarboxylate transport system permease small subunit
MPSATPLNSFTRAVDSISLGLAVVSFAMFAAVVLVLNHMVVIRLYGQPIVWHVELAIHLTLAAFFLGAPYAVLTRSHVAVELVPGALPPRPAKMLRFVIQLLVLAVSLYLAATGAQRAAHAFLTHERSTSLWAPLLWPVYATMPLGLALAGLQQIAELIKLVSQSAKGHT